MKKVALDAKQKLRLDMDKKRSGAKGHHPIWIKNLLQVINLPNTYYR